MSNEVTLSTLELDFLQETFELVLEEFEGIEEGRDNLDDYVLTTGALEAAREANELIRSLHSRAHAHDYEVEEDEEDRKEREEGSNA